MSKRLNTGFTLIEVMIVVAIIGILASIAYPSYVDSVRKGRRAEARAALTELMQQEERFMTQNNSYCAFSNSGGTITADPSCLGTVPFKTYSGDNATSPAYWLQASVCNVTTDIKDCVLVEATPTVTDPQAGILQIFSTGKKTCRGGSDPSVCWK